MCARHIIVTSFNKQEDIQKLGLFGKNKKLGLFGKNILVCGRGLKMTMNY